MNVLAFEASSDACSVALSVNGSIVERINEEPRKHAQMLLPMAQSLLEDHQLSLQTIDHFALTNGPGSFTGVRIALATVQGLAYGINKPVAMVSSLKVMAHLAFQSNGCDTCISLFDARMGEVYWAVYTKQNDALVELSAPAVSSPSVFNESFSRLQPKSSDRVLAVGHGVGVEGIDQNLFSSTKSELVPTAGGVLSLLGASGNRVDNYTYAADLDPLYLRNEIAWKKRQRIRDR